MCFLLFANLLHAARRAMAAACCCRGDIEPGFAWMDNLAELEAKLQEVGYDRVEDMVVERQLLQRLLLIQLQ